MADGFEENVEFFTLTYEAPLRVASHREFPKIAPLLWMRAGSRGRRIDDISQGWDVADTYGVLADLDQASDFFDATTRVEGVEVVYIVTDEDRLFESVAQQLPDCIEPVRLYESYLRNFEIESGRGCAVKFTLKDYQEQAVDDVLANLKRARDRSRTRRRPTRRSRSPPPRARARRSWRRPPSRRCSGATTTFDFEPDPGAVVLWFSDDPSLNKQTFNRLRQASEKFTYSNLVHIEPPFAKPRLEPGKVYFLNTQKLTKSLAADARPRREPRRRGKQCSRACLRGSAGHAGLDHLGDARQHHRGCRPYVVPRARRGAPRLQREGLGQTSRPSCVGSSTARRRARPSRSCGASRPPSPTLRRPCRRPRRQGTGAPCRPSSSTRSGCRSPAWSRTPSSSTSRRGRQLRLGPRATRRAQAEGLHRAVGGVRRVAGLQTGEASSRSLVLQTPNTPDPDEVGVALDTIVSEYPELKSASVRARPRRPHRAGVRCVEGRLDRAPARAGGESRARARCEGRHLDRLGLPARRGARVLPARDGQHAHHAAPRPHGAQPARPPHPRRRAPQRGRLHPAVLRPHDRREGRPVPHRGPGLDARRREEGRHRRRELLSPTRTCPRRCGNSGRRCRRRRSRSAAPAGEAARQRWRRRCRRTRWRPARSPPSRRSCTASSTGTPRATKTSSTRPSRRCGTSTSSRSRGASARRG